MIGNTGSNRLATVVRGIAQRAMEADGLALFRWNDFGVIEADYSLRLFGFSDPYPVGEYFVAHHLLHQEIMLVTEPETEDLSTDLNTNESGDPGHSHTVTDHAHPPHTHNIIRQRIFRKLLPGDRVIVSWANTSDPVVIDRYSIYDPTLP